MGRTRKLEISQKYVVKLKFGEAWMFLIFLHMALEGCFIPLNSIEDRS